MPRLDDMRLVPASVPETATFLDAARALFGAGVSAIAVLGSDRRVVGLFTDDDLLRGLFPRYLDELRHTAFLDRETAELSATLEKASAQPVRRYMRDPMRVEVDTSAVHVAERFLHCPWGALAVVESGRFIGMLDQLEFTEALMRRVGMEPE